MAFSKAVVRLRVPIIILALILLVPSAIGMALTRVNYDLLTYLPDEIDTMIGQDRLMEDFGKGAFSFIVVEGMPEEDVAVLRDRVEQVPHVDSAIWYTSFADMSIPMEMLPEKLYDAFNQGDATMIAVFFDGSTSEDGTMEAFQEIRRVCGEQCFVSGMTAMVLDLKDVCEHEEPIYVAIAVGLAVAAMMLLLDSFLAPIVFMASIGMAILYNMGTNILLGQISFITMALAAVLQLAVTMDYSIFLWHSYNEQLVQCPDKKEAMARAISLTLSSVVGSSITTVAGFVALCFMSFRLGLDMGLVMAKGVVMGVIGCVTILPSMILLLDRPLQRTRHRALIPDMGRLARGVTRAFPVFVALFAALVLPSYNAYRLANSECYYNLGASLPDYMQYVIAQNKLAETFDVASTHMLLLDTDIPEKDVCDMIDEMERVDGVKYVLGLESFTGPAMPKEMLPEKIVKKLQCDDCELMLINSEYQVASDEANAQIDTLNGILKRYDPEGMLIGEGPCMKDMIEITDHDFQVVNLVSIAAIFVIILLVTRSLSLPVILISVIELAIFINLGCAHYLGDRLPFIAPICISTIQLGATVDYAILMTGRYKAERISGKSRREAVNIALSTSAPSIIVSGSGLFAATYGVALYSDIDIISSICMLLARGAIISMILVILILPAMLMLCDGLIRHTTLGMKVKDNVGKEA
ncbi:MAG: MMPL family transporter [Kiritimatiellae bacterium]|nr:MMPL family transporter [Kiritimatiellia bacterium]